MECVQCRRPAIIFQRYSGRHLCEEHLCTDVEIRAKRTIRQNHWLVKGDRIGVISGLPSSGALVFFLEHLLERRTDVTIVRLALPPPPMPGKSNLKTPAWYQTLSEVAKDAGVTRVAFPDSSDKVAIQVLYAIFLGDMGLLTHSRGSMDIPVMLPFREIPHDELAIYAKQHGVPDEGSGIASVGGKTLEGDIKELLIRFSSGHPSAPHALRRYADHLTLLLQHD
ncbi:MAG TPA: hypothetical protein VN372_00435 [Methanospirillum sp.]|nr:hypothetical protein [Methanospirillum sp.]